MNSSASSCGPGSGDAWSGRCTRRSARSCRSQRRATFRVMPQNQAPNSLQQLDYCPVTASCDTPVASFLHVIIFLCTCIRRQLDATAAGAGTY